MGACDISFQLDKKATKDQIEKAFKDQQKADTERNGSRDGYTGDFQTVHKVDFHLEKVFVSADEAFEYCFKHAEKWSTVVAVYFNEPVTSKSKKLQKLRNKAKVALSEYTLVNENKLEISKAFKICMHCKSKLATIHIKGKHCPLCENNLMPKAWQNKLERLKNKFNMLADQINQLENAENQKQLEKETNLQTLVAGWGAC